MNRQYCPICGAEVHEECVVPPTASRFEDVWVLWFCNQCKWVSDWPGMPDAFRQVWPGMPVSDPAAARRIGTCRN